MHGANVKHNVGGQGAPLRILVVEDNADCAQTMAMLLRLKGYEVSIALTGPEALEIARRESPEVALLDIGLPGMNGYEVAKQLKGHIPLLVAVTGFGQEEDRRRSAEAGIDLHMLKPIDPTRLEALLREFKKMLWKLNVEDECPHTD